MSIDKITEILMGAQRRNDNQPYYGQKSIGAGMAQSLFANPMFAESKQRYDEQQKFEQMLQKANYQPPAAAAQQRQPQAGDFTASDWYKNWRAKRKAARG